MMSDNRLRWAYLPIIVLVLNSLSWGCGGPVGTPPPIQPTQTASPTPDLQTTSDVSVSVDIVDLILGVSARGYDHYQMGSTAVMGVSEPELFIDPKACGMKLKVRTMPTSALPGATAMEGLQAVYQQDYVEQSSGSISWTITQQPFELELNGEPAARLEAERVKNDRTALFQITVIRSQARSAIVEGQINEICAENPASMGYLNEMTDSVMIFDPAPVCYIGFKPGSDPAEYGVGCDSEPTGWKGPEMLADRDFTQIEMGPVTWDECAEFMRAHDQAYW